MEEADRLCDRVAIVDHGRLLALGTPGALKRTVGMAAEVRIQATGDCDALLTELRAAPGIAGGQVIDGTVHLYVGTDGPSLPEIIGRADRAGFAVHDVGISETSLETVFISLTGRELRE
ncbi:MAG: hypothetical protein ACKO1Y_10395 [Actinomycetota bacterium]